MVDNPANSAALILHPVRMRVILALGRGIPLTAQDLADLLPDVARATLYRHLAILVDGGVIEVVAEQRVRGAMERTYALRHGFASLSKEDLEAASREDHLRYFASFTASLIDEYARYLQRDRIDLAADGVSYREATVYMTDEEAADLSREVWSAIARRVGAEPSPRRPRTLAVISIPGQEAGTS
ncbi:MAG: helix-turn-helix domain-containing protein [Chloroflexota bacterium]